MRLSSRRSVRFWSLFVASLLVFAACGESESTGTTADGDTGEGSGEQIELVVWASDPWMLPPDDFAGFMEQYPNITVRTDLTPESDSLQKMQAMTEAGQPLPDLVMDDQFMLEAHNNAGQVLPIDELKARWEEEDPEGFADIFPTAWEENVIGGETLGLSLLANMEGLFYNPGWFEEAGIDPNTIDSLDELLDAMRTLKATRPDSIPLSLTALPGEGVTSEKAFMIAAGAEFDGAVPNLSSEGALYVIDWFMQAANEGLLPADAIAWEDGEAQGAFLGDRAALLIDGVHASGDFALEPDFDYGTDWGMIPIPPSWTGAQRDGNYANAPWTWFITTGSEHPYEASLLLRYMNEHLVDFVLEGEVSGPFRNTKALNDPRVLGGWPFWNDAWYQAYLASTPTPAGLNGGEVELILEQLFGEVIAGTDLTPQELADKYQPMLDDL